MESTALALGYGVMVVGAIALAAVVAVLAFAFFPARLQWSRDLPTHLDTPHGPLKLTAMVGLGSRRKARWFFGFMLLKPGEAPRAKVVARKATAV